MNKLLYIRDGTNNAMIVQKMKFLICTHSCLNKRERVVAIEMTLAVLLVLLFVSESKPLERSRKFASVFCELFISTYIII